MEWTTCCSPQFILKKIDNALSRAPHSDWKNKVPDFSFENSFSTYFQSKKPRKYSKNLVKPIHDLQKYKKLPQNSKSTWTKNLLELKYVFLGSFKITKKTSYLNFLHHMELFGTKINCFSGWNHRYVNFISLRWNLMSPSLSSHEKMKKIKFSNKIKFYNIKGTSHVIDKKDGRLKCVFQTNFKGTTYFIIFFISVLFFFNSIFSP